MFSVPSLPHGDLERVCSQALVAAGAPERSARIVAEHLVDNDLVGHASHGVIRLRDYVDFIKAGQLVPDAEPEIVSESAATAQVDGRWTFGQVAAGFATELAIDKARPSGISCVTVRNLNHLGRLGAYAETVANAGMASIFFAGGGGHGIAQTPFGGIERRLNSNPIAMSFPSQLEGPYVLDMATSAVAEGKLRLYRARGESTPPGWIVDSAGNSTTDPNDFYDGGALLPFGHGEGHKAYGIAFMVDLFGGILSGGGIPGDPAEAFTNDCTIIVINVEQFAPIVDGKRRAAAMTQYIKETRLLDESRPVLYPGEPEIASRLANLEKPIEIERTTWATIVSVLLEYSLGDLADAYS